MKGIDRRTFLKAIAAGGAAASMPLMFRRVTAQGTGAYGGPYWVFVTASGAWDPTFHFDPTLDPMYNRAYTEIREVGGISCAGIDVDFDMIDVDPTIGYEQYVLTPEQFLGKYASRLTVINGLDTRTNNHDAGQRAMASGQMAVGYPALGAMVAGVQAADLPMAYLSGGGYDFTGNIVPLTRAGNAGALRNVIRPNEMDPGNVDTGLFHTTETMARIEAAQSARNAALREAQYLPKLEQSMQQLATARLRTSELERLVLPTDPVEIPLGELRSLQNFQQSAQLALSAFTSGLAVSASLSMGGFDTHGNHNRDQTRRVIELFGGIDYLLTEAEQQGIADDLVVVVTSDFGRGPHYNGENDNAGKDHWPVTSVLALGPGIEGGRVVGATDGDRLARPVDPATLELSDSGIALRPEHVHQSLRRIAGLHDHELGERYPLPGDGMALFG